MTDLGNGVTFGDNSAAIAAQLHKTVSQLVRKAAFDIQAHAMTNAPNVTGFLESSIYTVTSAGSTYGQGLKGAGKPLPPVVDVAENDQTAYVAVGAAYGPYVEYGTSKRAAHPYLAPAFDTVVAVFRAAMGNLEAAVKDLSIDVTATGGEE